MNFCCIGGDRRQNEVAVFLKVKGHSVKTFGLPKYRELTVADSLFEAISGSDAVILPLPVSRDGTTVNTPLTDKVIFLQDILLYRPKTVFGGIIRPEFKRELENAGIEAFDYYESEALTVKNAVLTAEAAVAIAVNCTDRSIFGSKSLVLGYGRIGRQLARYLKAMGSEVTATSRNDGVLALIEADGITAKKTEKAAEACYEFDYIFNTAPTPLLDRNFFEKCSPTAFVEDLATDSGLDLAAAHEFNINAAVYGGLPGKHSPVSAARFIAEEILFNSENGGKYAK